MRVALIRPGEWDGNHLVRALDRVSSRVVDASRPEQITILELGSDIPTDVLVRGSSLTAFDRVVFLGTPLHNAEGVEPTRDELFVREEREAALLAALHGMRARVVNRGDVFCHSRLLREPTHQVRVLARLGWRTPRVRTTFLFPSGQEQKQRDPDPGRGTRYLLVVTQRRYFVHPYLHVRFSQGENIDALVARTQDHMHDHGLDWSVIPIVSVDNRVHAFGMTTRLPAELGPESLAGILHDAIG